MYVDHDSEPAETIIYRATVGYLRFNRKRNRPARAPRTLQKLSSTTQ